MPKDHVVNKSGNTVPRPQTLSPTKTLQNGDMEQIPKNNHHNNVDGCANESATSHDSPQNRKVERTKSILKQSSKEKEGGGGDLSSPRKENITFAPENRDSSENGKVKTVTKQCDSRDVDQEVQCDILKNNCTEITTVDGEPVKTMDKQIGNCPSNCAAQFLILISLSV